MSLYHSFRKTGKKKEISNRPQSCPLGSDSRILYAHIKTGMQKSIPVLLVRQAGIEPAAFTIEQGISLIA